MTERFEDILTKEEAYVKRSDIKDEKKAERFKLLMEATKKKLALKEKRAMIEEKKVMLDEKKAMLEEKNVKIAADTEGAKMLSLNVGSLDVDARTIVQAIRYKMLQRQKDELETACKEEEEAVEKEAEAKASYAAAMTP